VAQKKNKGVVETKCGQALNLLAPQAASITLEDIAHGLANTCRFGRMADPYYSVAQHSILVSRWAEEENCSLEIIQAALLHDAHEPFLGDIATPLKRSFRSWRKLAEQLDKAIGKSLAVDHTLFETPVVKEFDYLALSVEAYQLMPVQISAWDGDLIPREEIPAGKKITRPLPPAAAKKAFLARARQLNLR